MFSILNLALTKYQILFTLGVQTDGSTKKLTKTIDLANEMKGQFASMGSKLATSCISQKPELIHETQILSFL